jgi:hypothetical protein
MLTIDWQGSTAAADRSTLVYAQSQEMLGSLVYSAVKNRNKQSSRTSTVLVLFVLGACFSLSLVMLCVAGGFVLGKMARPWCSSTNGVPV